MFEVLLKLNILNIHQNDQRQRQRVLEMSLYFQKVLDQHPLQVNLQTLLSFDRAIRRLFYAFVLAVNSSSSQFILAEQMARRGAPDERILGVINPPMTQLSLEEQQIQESLMRLDNRLLNIQVCYVVGSEYRL